MSSHYIVPTLENHGLYWSAGDLRALKQYYQAGKPTSYIALQMKRTEQACDNMYREIRRMELLSTGAPDDTLLTLRKKEKSV